MEDRIPRSTENKSEFYDIDNQIKESESTTPQPTSSDVTNSNQTLEKVDPHDLEETVEKLRSKLEEKEEQNQKNKDRYLRALADYENLEKRTNAERSRLLKNATSNLIIKLLDFADTLEKARDSFVDSGNEQEVLKDGFLAVEKHFLAILKNEGVEKLNSLGTPFDPNFHEVVSVRTDSGEEDNVILEEVQAGYILNSSLLRPSKVIIAKK